MGLSFIDVYGFELWNVVNKLDLDKGLLGHFRFTMEVSKYISPEQSQDLVLCGI